MVLFEVSSGGRSIFKLIRVVVGKFSSSWAAGWRAPVPCHVVLGLLTTCHPPGAGGEQEQEVKLKPASFCDLA